MHGETHKRLLMDDGVEVSYYLHRCPQASHTLLMIHGLASNHTRWSEFVTDTCLGDKMNLLRVDLRGHGQSMTWSGFSHKRWVEDLYSILKQEELRNVIVIGHSLGAQTALNMLVSHPESVRGLLLIDPVLPSQLKGMLRVISHVRIFLSLAIHTLRFFYRFRAFRKHYSLRDLYRLDQQTRAWLNEQPGRSMAEVYGRPWSDMLHLPLGNYLQDVYELTSPLPAFASAHCPLLLLLSAGSSIVEIDEIKKAFASMSLLEVEEIQADHWPLTEKPQQTREAIEKWCLRQVQSQQ